MTVIGKRRWVIWLNDDGREEFCYSPVYGVRELPDDVKKNVNDEFVKNHVQVLVGSDMNSLSLGWINVNKQDLVLFSDDGEREEKHEGRRSLGGEKQNNLATTSA